MSSLAAIEPIGGAVAQEADGHLYIALIQRAMQAKDISLRSLSMRAGISKSRLGRILHSNCAERASITLSEFRVLLEALEIDLIQAIIKVESIRDQKVLADERYVALIAMLASLFKELPASLIQALAEIDGLDGSEVRKDWAPQLQTVVIKRMVHEVTNVLRRREQIFEDRYDLRG